MSYAESELLRQSQGALNAAPVIATVAERFLTQRDEMADTAAQIIVLEIPDYSLLLSAAGLRETWEHGRRQAEEIARLLRGNGDPDMTFVRSLGRRRAEQRFPLRHVLHTFRIGHRVTWALLRECLEKATVDADERLGLASDLFDFTISYTNMISVVAETAYIDRQRELGNVSGQRTRQFFHALINGQPLDPDVLTFARASGLETSPLHILIARKSDNTPASIIDTHIAKALNASGDQPLCVMLDDMVVGLLPADVLETLFCEGSGTRSRLTVLLESEEMLAGISGPISLAAQGKAAFREAVFASELATKAHRIMRIDSVALIDVAMTRPDLDLQRLLPDWLNAWHRLTDGTREDLERTLEAFANADMHARATAEALGLHPNTIGFRLTKIRDLTNLNPRNYHDLTQIRTVLRIASEQ